MNGLVEIIVIVVVIGYLLVRRLSGEPAEGKRMLMLPAIITAIGLMDLGKVTQPGVSIAFLIATTAISLGIGVVAWSKRSRVREGRIGVHALHHDNGRLVCREFCHQVRCEFRSRSS